MQLTEKLFIHFMNWKYKFYNQDKLCFAKGLIDLNFSFIVRETQADACTTRDKSGRKCISNEA